MKNGILFLSVLLSVSCSNKLHKSSSNNSSNTISEKQSNKHEDEAKDHHHNNLIALDWNFNDTKILATKEGYSGLYIVNATTLKIEKTFLEGYAVGFNATFGNDNYVYFREKQNYQFVVKRLNTETGEVITDNTVPAYGLRSFVKAKAGEPFVQLNEKMQLEIGTKGSAATKQLTFENEAVFQCILSPDKKNVLVHTGNRILLYPVENKGYVKDLGTGLVNCWLNNNWVLMQEETSLDGHILTDCDIVALNINTLEKQYITSDKNSIEIWPVANNAGTKITYANNSKEILVIKPLNLK